MSYVKLSIDIFACDSVNSDGHTLNKTMLEYITYWRREKRIP